MIKTGQQNYLIKNECLSEDSNPSLHIIAFSCQLFTYLDIDKKSMEAAKCWYCGDPER